MSSHLDFDAMIEHASRAAALADGEGDLAVRLFPCHWLGSGEAWLGRWEECVRVFDQNIALGGGDAAAEIEVLGWRPYVESSAIRAAALSIQGRPREGLEFVERFSHLQRRARSGADLSSAASDRLWPCWALGDAPLAQRCSAEALQLAERFGSARNIVYALLACGNASPLGLRWAEGRAYLERARELIVTTGAGSEWSPLVESHYALCLAELGERERTRELAQDQLEQEWNDFMQACCFALVRALRVVSDGTDLDRLDALVARTLGAAQRTQSRGFLPLILLERAAVARLRGDSARVASDLAEAERRFAEMGVTGWDDYARSIANLGAC